MSATLVRPRPGESARARAERHRENGRRFGYPRCCVEQYVRDAAAGRLPYTLRGGLPAPSGEGVYVPCDGCREAARRGGETIYHGGHVTRMQLLRDAHTALRAAESADDHYDRLALVCEAKLALARCAQAMGPSHPYAPGVARLAETIAVRRGERRPWCQWGPADNQTEHYVNRAREGLI